MKILIVGGGIGGLAAAGFLERKGFDVTLIERAPEFKNIGFSMTLFPNGRRLLRELGVDDEVAQHGHEIPWLELADSRGHILGQIHFKELLKSGESLVSIERAKLHHFLVKNLKRTKVHLDTTIKELRNHPEKVEVVFKNGTKGSFDLLVAADGINSEIREEFFESNQLVFHDWSLRFFWVPSHIPVPKGALCLSKEKCTFAIYPSLEKCCIGIYEYNPKRINHPPLVISDFLPYLKRHGWDEKHLEDIKKEAEKGHQYYDHLKHTAMGKWYKKRIVLLGDARHGLSPISGMGASMALEDAFVLADELSKVDIGGMRLALEKYSQRRTKRVKLVIALSKFSERFYFIKSPLERFIRDLIARILPEKFLLNKFRTILEGPL